MKILDKIASEVRGYDSATDIEDACRATVAAWMRREQRLPERGELEGLVADVVAAEDIVDPADHLHEANGRTVCVLTAEQLDNLDETYEDGDGDPVVPVEGKLVPVDVVDDGKKGRIADRIERGFYEGWFGQKQAGEPVPTFESLYVRAADTLAICPECGSLNTAQTWYDGSTVVNVCSDCGCEFETAAEPEEETVEEMTVQDDDVIDCPADGVYVDGESWYDPECGCWNYQVWMGEDLVTEGSACSYEEVADVYDRIFDFYLALAENGMLRNVETGVEMPIGSVEGDAVEIAGTGRSASRVRLAARLAEGRMLLDRSDVLMGNVAAGEGWHSAALGNDIEVASVDSDGVLFVESGVDPDTSRGFEDEMLMPLGEFLAYADDNGYVKLPR